MAKTLDELIAQRKKIKEKLAAGQGNSDALQNRLGNVKGQIQQAKGLTSSPGQSKFDTRLDNLFNSWAESNFGSGFSTPAGVTKTIPNAIDTQDAYNIGVMGRQDDFNRPNESNPFGSRSYSVGPDGRVVQTDSLSPNQGRILGQQEGMDIGLGNFAANQFGSVQQSYANPFSLSGFRNDPNSIDFSADRRRIEDEIAGRFEELNAGRFARDTQRLAQSQLDRGLDPNSPAAVAEREQQTRAQEDARRAAQLGAIGMGGEEMQRSYNLSQDARSRAVNESLMQRDRPFAEMTSILGGIRGPMLPNFQARSEIGVPQIDILGAASGAWSQNNSQNWQASENAKNRALQERLGQMGMAGTLGYQERLGLINAERDAAIARDNNAAGRPPKPTAPPGGQSTAQPRSLWR